ncbi:hypothetical protein Slin15195_G096990 [Septoria linicola]|uniref:Uncharacterized protein n=1 Tax=Septoria linicola TaxID=215465 RepID=A0A9Q9B1B8_9PEZI|nr:hypothetical protein Slin14017_G060080 [Septoria linicola]USW56380.1 hypothetical protein Slin15195_G096990 [Septoria linicola]
MSGKPTHDHETLQTQPQPSEARTFWQAAWRWFYITVPTRIILSCLGYTLLWLYLEVYLDGEPLRPQSDYGLPWYKRTYIQRTAVVMGFVEWGTGFVWDRMKDRK